jgi:hypothetical protein
MDWFKRLLGNKSPDRPADVPPAASAQEARYEPPAAPAQEEEDPELQRILEEGYAARTAVYRTLGEVDPDVIAPLINPTFMGGPRWPALRQAWQVVRRPASTIIVSDGLSDPFDDDLTPLGFQVEVCVETDERFEDLTRAAHSWLFALVNQAAQLVASHGGMYEAIEKYGTISTVFRIPDAPAQVKSSDDKVGVLIGFPSQELPTEIEFPQGRVRLLVVKPLLSSELAYIESGESGDDRKAARDDLVARLLQQPRAHFATADRPAVA